MLATVYAIIKNSLLKFVYQSPIVFLTIWEMVICFYGNEQRFINAIYHILERIENTSDLVKC